MKKSLACILCLTCLLSCAACTHADRPPSETAASEGMPTASASAESVPPTAEQNEPLTALFEAVLQNELCVYDVDRGEYIGIDQCKAPYTGLTLDGLEDLRYAFVDMDGDGAEEMVLDCGDTLIFRYHANTVWCYSVPFRNMDRIHTDGSYTWHHTGAEFAYGASRLSFSEDRLETEELWRVVNDGTPDAVYYLGGEQVSSEAFARYVAEHPTTEVGYTPLSASWQNEISHAEALRIAEAHWSQWSSQEGYRVEQGVNPRAPAHVYVMLIRRWVMDHYTTIDEIWVDQTTGECLIPQEEHAKG